MAGSTPDGCLSETTQSRRAPFNPNIPNEGLNREPANCQTPNVFRDLLFNCFIMKIYWAKRGGANRRRPNIPPVT